MRSVHLSLITALIASTGGLLVQSPAQAAVAATWCWSMQSGALKGTFTTSGTMPGDGTAPAGAYTLSDGSVYESAYPDIETGSVSDGTYQFGSQPDYQIIWDGSAATGYWRNVGGGGGTLTNGLGLYNGVSGSGAYLGFNVGYQSADTTYLAGGTRIFVSFVSPDLIPIPASGLCPGQTAPPPSAGDSGNSRPDVIEQYGRLNQDDACDAGWGSSYAMWMNDGTGGWVCTRTLRYTNGNWLVL